MTSSAMRNALTVLIVPLLFTTGCALFRPLGLGGDGNGNGAPAPTQQALQPQAQGVARATPSRADRAQQQSRAGETPQVVTRRVTDDRDTATQLAELRFEIKRMNAEISHLNSEIVNLNNRSDMWRNPQDVYTKKIVLANGTTFNGNVVYQDEQVVKVETLIGSLVLRRDSITRIVENIPETLAEDFQPSTPLKQPARAIREVRGRITSEGTRLANVVLDGTIKEKKDYSGNTIFRGVVKNVGTRRADFVKVNFVIRKDWAGTTRTLTTFVDGAQTTYETGITTDTALLPGASGSFELYVPRSVGPFIGYSYSIDWEEFE